MFNVLAQPMRPDLAPQDRTTRPPWPAGRVDNPAGWTYLEDHPAFVFAILSGV